MNVNADQLIIIDYWHSQYWHKKYVKAREGGVKTMEETIFGKYW